MIDRYYLVHDDHMPTLEVGYGEHHAMDLGSHGKAGKGYHVVVLCDPHGQPPATWTQFPNPLDPVTPIKNVLDHTKLADLGLNGDEPAYSAIAKISKFHPRIRP